MTTKQQRENAIHALVNDGILDNILDTGYTMGSRGWLWDDEERNVEKDAADIVDLIVRTLAA